MHCASEIKLQTGSSFWQFFVSHMGPLNEGRPVLIC